MKKLISLVLFLGLIFCINPKLNSQDLSPQNKQPVQFLKSLNNLPSFNKGNTGDNSRSIITVLA